MDARKLASLSRSTTPPNPISTFPSMQQETNSDNTHLSEYVSFGTRNEFTVRKS